MVDVEMLCPCGLFEGLSQDELQEIAALAMEETYQAGELICVERELAERLFIICTGRVELRIHLLSSLEPDAEVALEEVEPGSVFGWSSLVKQRRFTASVKALETSRVIALEKDDLNALFDRNPHIGFVVMKQLAEVIASRLRRTRELYQESDSDCREEDSV